MALVSIILTVYNNARDITAAIKSVFAQTYGNWQLIIVDDGSTDDLHLVMVEYINYDKIIFIKNSTNLGRYISLNIGINASKGKYIAIIDSDDTYAPDKIKEQVKVMERKPNIICTRTLCNKANILIKIAPATIMFRKKIIQEIGYFDSVRFGADSEFYYRILRIYGKKSSTNINKVLYFATIRFGSLTSNPLTLARKTRQDYKKNYKVWHKSKNLFMPFPLIDRPFPVDPIMITKIN